MKVFNSLLEKYVHLGWSVAAIKGDGAFTIIDLKKCGFEFPLKTPTFRLNFFVFSFIKDGAGNYKIDDQQNTFQPRTFFFTNPSHCRSFECKYLKEGHFMTFSETFLKEYVEHNVFDEFPFLLNDSLPPVIFKPEDFAKFELIYLMIEKEYNSTSPLRYRIIGSLLTFLFLKLKEHLIANDEDLYEHTRGVDIVRQFKRILEAHHRELAAGIVKKVNRLQDYGSALNLHPNYLSSTIKTITGKSVKAWIAEKTVSEAKSLLQNSRLSVNEIGYRLGFITPSHFNNFFKKNVNVSPGTYRKMNATDTTNEIAIR